MSGDIFLDLDGCKGESIKDGHKDQIEIESFSWGGSNPTSFAAGGGGGVGKVAFQDIHLTKSMDAASPTLYQFCANGKHITKGTITFRKAGEKPQDYLKIELTDIMVSSFNCADHSAGGQLAQDSFSLAFAKVEMKYKPQKSDGTVGEDKPFGWNIKEHKPAP